MSKMTWKVIRESDDALTCKINNYLWKQELEPNFDDFTTEELFNHLIDLHQIPYEEEFENWIHLKAQMIEMCKDSYDRSREIT